MASVSRARSVRWSARVGSSSSTYRFCTAGRRITCRPTPTVAALGRVVSGGTSTVEVAGRRAPGRPAASRRRAGSRVKVRTSWREIGACRTSTRTLHLWQVPWPPQVESIAMPFHDAESKTVTPGGTRTSRCAGATPSRSRDGERRARPGRCRRAAPARRRAARAGPRGRRRRGRSRGAVRSRSRARPASPAACRGAVARRSSAMPHSSWPSSRSAALTASTICGRAGVHDRAGQAGGHRHRQERARRGCAGRACRRRRWRRRRSCSRRTRRGSGASSPASCDDRAGVGADRHRQRVDDDVRGGDAVLRRWRPG